MRDENLIADLIRAGLSPELVGRVVVELMSLNVPQMSGTIRDNVPDTWDTKTEYERRRKANWRLKTKGGAKANDVVPAAECPPNVPQMSLNVPDTGDNRCNLLSSLSLTESVESKKESSEKKENKKAVTENAHARGTRLVPGQTITEADWTFAIDAGVMPAVVERAWAEFVDYWIAIPGQRGVKLNWSATWRNRVRELIKRGNVNGRQDDRKSLIAACDRQLERFGGMEAARGYVPGSSGPTPLLVDLGQMPADRKRIS